GDITHLTQPVGPAALVDGDVIDVSKRNLCLAQAIGDCLGGKSCPVLNPAEALLFGCGNEHSVAEKRGRRVAVERIESENNHVARGGTDKKRSRVTLSSTLTAAGSPVLALAQRV